MKLRGIHDTFHVSLLKTYTDDPLSHEPQPEQDIIFSDGHEFAVEKHSLSSEKTRLTPVYHQTSCFYSLSNRDSADSTIHLGTAASADRTIHSCIAYRTGSTPHLGIAYRARSTPHLGTAYRAYRATYTVSSARVFQGLPLIQSVAYLLSRCIFSSYKAPELFVPTSSQSDTILPTV